MKMPVKVDSSRCRSPTPAFDCDDLFDQEFDQELVNDCLSDLDVEMWGHLTPPASPQMKLDFLDLNLDNLLDDCDDLMIDFDQKLISNHDCMWSGQCSQGQCNSSSKPSTSGGVFGSSAASSSSLMSMQSSGGLSSSWNSRAETPSTYCNLSTSPITSSLLGDFSYSELVGLSDLTSLLEEDDLASATTLPQTLSQHSLLQPQQQQHFQQMHQQQSGNVFAGMANDHSYESSSPVSTIKEEFKEEFEDGCIVKKESSLLNKNPIKILNAGKINKMKCKKNSGVSHKQNSSSLLNNSTIYRPSSSSIIIKGETSLVKPQHLIQVTNLKNLPESIKYRQVPTIKKKISLVQAKDAKCTTTNGKLANGGRPMIQVKKLPNHFASNISSLISPNTSDSEESGSGSSSSTSGDDNNNRKNSPPFRRREHNDSERKRRDHLRNSFNNLKDQIPKLKSAEKRPPRIMILHEATNYVNTLISTNYSLEKTLEAEKEKKKRLMSLLKSMQQDS